MAKKSKIKFLETNGKRWSYCYTNPLTCSNHNHVASRKLAEVLNRDAYDVGFFDRTVVGNVNGEDVSYIDYIIATSDYHESDFDCQDCGLNTLYVGEYYMVHDAIWYGANLDKGMACIGCLESRIGRSLKSTDFTDAPVNNVSHSKSERILKRMLEV